MKKKLLLSILLLCFVGCYNVTFAKQLQPSKSAIIRTNVNEQLPTSDKYKITEVNGKYAIIDTETGKIIPEEQLYSISKPEKEVKVISEGKIDPIITDLKPEIKKYVIKLRQTEKMAQEAYKPVEEPLPPNVQMAGISENVVEKTIETVAPVVKNSTKVLWVGTKKFTIVQKDSLFGLLSETGQEIISPQYDNLVIANLSNPYVLAVKNNAISAFNLNGKLLAEQVYDKINVYKYGKLYSYSNTDGTWLLKSNNKKIGMLTVNGNDYSFDKISNFNLFNYTAVNDVFMTILNSISK